MSLPEKFRSIKDYIVYYGSGREAELSKYSMAVVEPLGHNQDEIWKLKKHGTITAAYLSVVEIHPSSPEFKLVRQEDILSFKGSPVVNSDYETFLMDMSSERWRNILMQRALQLCLKYNYDGLFLDTLGDVETGFVPHELRRMQLIMIVDFVKGLRKLLPDRIIIQNNGMDEIFLYTSDYIDGICWENPQLFVDNAVYLGEMVEKLKLMKVQKRVQPMFLASHIKMQEHIEYIQKIAADYEFLFYEAPFGYTEL